MIPEEYEDSEDDERHQTIPDPELTEEQIDNVPLCRNKGKEKSHLGLRVRYDS